MIYKNKADARALTGLSYIGNVNHSSKHEKALDYDELVYTIYLAPARMSGYEVCPMRTEECTLLCLNESGHNRIDTKTNRINNSRIAKTQLFFKHRTFFVNWVIDEIKSAKARAEKLGYKFSVRLNNTSDLSPESFYIKVKDRYMNLLEIFPDVQFYDYTKIPKRVKLMEKYLNYDVTFSYSGENMHDCLAMLQNNVRVAMVFTELPAVYVGKKVIDGDKYDMRYYDDKDVIVGLKYKKSKKQFRNNKQICNSMKGLKEFLENTEQEELKIEMLPIEDINALLKPHGFEINHETLDTNGWSIDFWVLFENEHYPFDLQLGGSWYYGNYVLTKTKTDEEW